MRTPLRVAAILPLAAGLACSIGFARTRPAEATPPAGQHTADKLADPHASITPERMIAHIRSLPTARAAWGDGESKKGLRETETLLAGALKAMGYAPELDPVDFVGSRGGDKDAEDAGKREPWNNIIVEIPGRSVPDQVLVLAAHFDAVPNSPGADDNGSGVAAVLEAARVLKDRPMQRTVRLIFFNLEEVGLVGSRAYVQRIKPRLEEKKETIVGMISIDMIGFYSTEPDSQKSPLPPMGKFKPPTVGDFIGLAGILAHRTFSQALDKEMHKAEPAVKTVAVDFLPIAPPDLLRSDHAPFLAAGVPAVILSDTANFRSPHYHKATDTVETLDAERLAIGARAIVGAIHALAGPEGTELIDLSPSKPAAAPEAAPGEEPKEDTGTPRSDAPVK